jgi:hypothetical protein
VVLVGPTAGGQSTVSAGGTTYHVTTVQKGAAPAAQAEGQKLKVGNQTFSCDG